MNASPFRSHLMQAFAANARSQARPPIALFSLGGGGGGGGVDHPPSPADRDRRRRPSSSQHPRPRRRSASSTAATSVPLGRRDDDSSRDADASAHRSSPSSSPPPPATAEAEALQRLIVTRRTVSNFLSRPPPSTYRSSLDDVDIDDLVSSSSSSFLRDAISRGVACASTAPNHRITEPSTFHRILAPSSSHERLIDIAYEVTLRRLLDGKLSGDEACRSEASRKREKWGTIPAFVIATVSGMEDQEPSSLSSSSLSTGGFPGTMDVGDYHRDDDPYVNLPHVPPSTITQLEDYASTCASVQNLLLSLHAEGLGCKWATGPVIRTKSFRELIRCRRDEMVVGLIMVGWVKRLPALRRRRELEGDVLRDVDYYDPR
ncbi:hypothetical protein ACHAXA_006720 [Cyclostephanos tholiformis]|uniref:Nitroreductase domain-containing protein n=1 Tax=Cyclostephanos tholiformis TaxID=382380 RepID=A0ABD3SRC5_9STRA